MWNLKKIEDCEFGPLRRRAGNPRPQEGTDREWDVLRTRLLIALEAHREARLAVWEALRAEDL